MLTVAFWMKPATPLTGIGDDFSTPSSVSTAALLMNGGGAGTATLPSCAVTVTDHDARIGFRPIPVSFTVSDQFPFGFSPFRRARFRSGMALSTVTLLAYVTSVTRSPLAS